jgi:hypothetical protein
MKKGPERAGPLVGRNARSITARTTGFIDTPIFVPITAPAFSRIAIIIHRLTNESAGDSADSPAYKRIAGVIATSRGAKRRPTHTADDGTSFGICTACQRDEQRKAEHEFLHW